MSAISDLASGGVRTQRDIWTARYGLLMLGGVLGLVTSLWAGYFYAPGGEDSRDYVALARNVVAGNGLSLSKVAPFQPSASRAPVYPVFLGLIYSIAGESREGLLIAQSVVFAIGCALLVSLAALLFNRRVALVTCLVFSLNPYFARWAGSVLTEAVYMTLLIACVFVFTKGLLASSTHLLALSGAIWAVATLCRPLTLVLLPLMLITVYLFLPRLSGRGAKVATILLAGLLTIAPWTIRNWVSFGMFIPVQARAFGFNLWLTTLDREDQPVTDWVEIPGKWPAKYPEVNEWFAAAGSTPGMLTAEKHLGSVALKRIANDPLRYIRSRISSLPHLWLHSGKLWYTDISFQSAFASGRYVVLGAKVVLFLLFSFLPLVLALAGIYLTRRDWRRLLPLYLIPVVIGVMHLPMWIEERYGMPAVPFFLIFAAVALTNFKSIRKSTPLAVGILDKAEGLDRYTTAAATITVIIPAKNEGNTIVDLAEAVKSYCDEVIVVDGHSTDGSGDTLRDRGFRVLTDNRRGKGDAVRCGLEAATGDVVVIMDADGSHEPEDIPKLVGPILNGEADMVIGCRMRGGSDEFAGTWELFIRLWGNNFLTMLLNTRYGSSLTDTQNGFRAARRGVLNVLALRENKHTIELEMVMKALKKGYRVCQVQSHEYCRRAGVSSLSIRKQGPHFLRCLLRNIW
jgi:dolichol-phosphate mannosyltransferase